MSSIKVLTHFTAGALAILIGLFLCTVANAATATCSGNGCTFNLDKSIKNDSAKFNCTMDMSSIPVDKRKEMADEKFIILSNNNCLVSGFSRRGKLAVSPNELNTVFFVATPDPNPNETGTPSVQLWFPGIKCESGSGTRSMTYMGSG